MRTRIVYAALVLAAVAALAFLWRGTVPAPATLPGVSVAGGDGGALPRATPEAENLNPVALHTALDSAIADGASAFLIARHGHLLTEHYGAGFSADTLIDGGAMTESLVVLSVGIAAAEGKLVAADVVTQGSDVQLAALRSASSLNFEDYLSQHLWQPLNAGPARYAGCCVLARARDWIRVGMLLQQSGNFEGNDIVSAAWVARMRAPLPGNPGRGLGVWLGADASGAEPFASNDVFYLRGRDRSRLWLVPALQLTVLFVAGPAGANGWDETRLMNQLIRAVNDRSAGDATRSTLNQLVPGH
jgi:CubicO group peptidase (beta-lactamase class C family)